MNLIASEILEVKNGTIKRVPGTYEDYVWQMEQEAENNSKSLSNITSYEATNQKYASALPPTDKETRKKLYELNKELSKIEKKIANLQSLINQGQDIERHQAVLNDQEIVWLELQDKIEALR